MIPEAEHIKAKLLQRFVTPEIPRLLPSKAMLLAINFNEKLPVQTGEIDDKGPDWHLLPKVKTLCFELF